MAEQNDRTIKDEAAPKYGVLYFDHLQGEFAAVAATVTDDGDNKILDKIREKRKNRALRWKDIYTYELILLKYLDFETLKSKIISLRIKYQNLVHAAEYDEYITKRAVDLAVAANPGALDNMRADYKYLLDEFYLRYAFISAREDFRTKLLRYGTIFTLAFFALAAAVSIISRATDNAFLYNLTSVISTLFIVVFAGITGAFVSMQQRLQNISNQGDPVYNLSLLTHGWLSIFLSPISGAIFAVILYLFFTSQLLTGNVFPVIKTREKPTQDMSISGYMVPDDEPSGEKASTDGASSAEPVQEITTNNANAANKNANAVNKNASVANKNASVAVVASPTSETPPPSPSPGETTQSNDNSSANAVTVTQNSILGLTDFLSQTGPATGKDFALLIVWSFIAGFAERFVPDTLMRLVNKKDTAETTNT